MQYTENYNLNKPELTDVADITKISENMDIIDEELEKRTTKTGLLTDLIAHLASDAAIAIQSLSTDSVFYRLLSYALAAAGVQYNFTNANAWYICLGALFGGLIIQGGVESGITRSGKSISYSVSGNSGSAAICVSSAIDAIVSSANCTTTGFTCYSSASNGIYARWVAFVW